MASLLYFMMGYLYCHVINSQHNFMTMVVASGAGNTSKTGKSLMTNMWHLAFEGNKLNEGTMTITEAAIFKQLDKGRPVYSKYYIYHLLSF